MKVSDPIIFLVPGSEQICLMIYQGGILSPRFLWDYGGDLSSVCALMQDLEKNLEFSQQPSEAEYRYQFCFSLEQFYFWQMNCYLSGQSSFRIWMEKNRSFFAFCQKIRSRKFWKICDMISLSSEIYEKFTNLVSLSPNGYFQFEDSEDKKLVSSVYTPEINCPLSIFQKLDLMISLPLFYFFFFLSFPLRKILWMGNLPVSPSFIQRLYISLTFYICMEKRYWLLPLFLIYVMIFSLYLFQSFYPQGYPLIYSLF